LGTLDPFFRGRVSEISEEAQAAAAFDHPRHCNFDDRTTKDTVKKNNRYNHDHIISNTKKKNQFQFQFQR